ncbi:hypothetical protein QVD17_36570 [Tagetes erecta]|uniref:F-box/kelch-repeat protein n=1 Tax=Tagetes erecta TaxID=13708 RepID=A0AAD8JWM5_TARER|nr:hypothetical protein QVD17_36570 [Tagetes erecta]
MHLFFLILRTFFREKKDRIMSKAKELVNHESDMQDYDNENEDVIDYDKSIVVYDGNKNGYLVNFNSQKSTEVKPQDADYTIYINPSLSYELENLILARFPRSEYWKLSSVNKRFSALVKSGEVFKIRRDVGFIEPSVLMLASGENCWWAFDQQFGLLRRLPVLPSDICFASGDKESVCAGTHLLVSGREIEGLTIWRYELAMNKWYKGPAMMYPRCLFASATCGTFAYVAGGIVVTGGTQFVNNTVEKYDPETRSWTLLPRMTKPRKLCSGCYMDNMLYVIGGRNDDGELTCGEFFDPEKNEWILIPEMLKDNPVLSCHSPPLIAVVNNELYSIEATSNLLKIYLKNSNSWKPLGLVPVRADYNRGWGVAFKSFGNKLLVIGASTQSSSRGSMAIYTCSPEPDSDYLPEWELLDNGKIQLSHFIMNCCVMVA